MKQLRFATFVFSILIALSLIAQPMFSAQAATANIIVTPASADWAFVNDNGTTGDWSTGFVSGPATPPLGVGSINIQLNSIGAGIIFGTQKYQGTRLADITALSYSTYTNLDQASMAFQINYDPDVTTVEASTWYGRLIYEPYMNGDVYDGTWQTWDMLNGGAGKWWASGNANSPVDNACPHEVPCTLTDLLAAYPNIGIRNDALSGIGFKAGSNWNGFNGNVDNFTFETAGNTDIYNFEPVTTVYVDDDWAGTTLGADPDGAGPAASFGADAFDVIQDGIDAVATGGTVQVFAGTYVEDPMITKPLSLLGPNAVIDPNTGVRVTEAILHPAYSAANYPNDPNNCETMVYLNASNVNIQGFTFDGDNPNLTSGIMLGTADVDACEIIAGWDGLGNINVENNILKNATYAAIDLSNYSNPTVSSGNYIRHNLIQDVGVSTIPYGIGIITHYNFYADVTNNVLTNVRVGVQTGNYTVPNPGVTGNISDNVISAWRGGIFHNMWYSNPSAILVANNTITAISSTDSTKWNGILISSFQTNADTALVNNIINIGAVTQNPAVGYNIWNTPTTATITIYGGSVTGGNYGVWVNNYEGYNSSAANTSIDLDNVTITGASGAGVYVLDSASNTNGSTVYANIQNSTITNSAVGILVSGSDASAVANFNTISGNTAGVTNTSGVVMNAENNNWGSNFGPNDPAGTIEVPTSPEPSVADMLNAAPAGQLGNGVSDNVDYYPFMSNAPLAISPVSIDFGSVLVATSAGPQTVTITNTGATDVVFGTLVIPGEFALGNDTCSGATVTPGNVCSFDVYFNPTLLGAQTGAVTIASNAATSPDSVALSGNGVSIPPGENLLQKPDFAGAFIFPYPWQPQGLTRPYSSSLDCNATFFISGPCAVKLTGVRNTFKAVTQTVTRTGLAGDQYIFGLSSRAQNVPLSGGQYKVEVFFFNKLGRMIGSSVVQIGRGTHGFETMLGNITAPAAYSKIRFRFVYQHTSGTTWFDDAFLIPQVAP